MNREKFINKEIINKDNQRGIVISFDENYLVIKYEKEVKTYSSDAVFKNQYVSFLDKHLNNLIDEEMNIKKRAEILEEENIKRTNRNAVQRNKKIDEIYNRLLDKSDTLQVLFGRDFIYPPLVKFKKRYRYLLKERTHEDLSAAMY